METRTPMASEPTNQRPASPRKKIRTRAATSSETKMYTLVTQSNKNDCHPKTGSTTATPNNQVSPQESPRRLLDLTKVASCLNVFD